MRTLSALACLLVSGAPALAQITYIDADPAVNTTLANGTSLPTTGNVSGTDGLWCWRATGAANRGRVLEANSGGGGGEDCPMLRTTIDGLEPGRAYTTYAYFWGYAPDLWRGRALVATAPPPAPIPGYNTGHFAGSSYEPMTPLSSASFLGLQQVSLGLASYTDGTERDGHFATIVKIREGSDSFLFEVPLGVAIADAAGEIHVYVDDLENQGWGGNRTRYDGVGYALAPQTYGVACGAPAPQISASGHADVGRELVVELAAAANAPAVLLAGFRDDDWNGVPLPLDLAPLGFGAGCWLQASPDLTLATTTDAGGDAAAAVAIPAIELPIGSLYFQWATLMAAGFQFSQGLRALPAVGGTHLSPIGKGWARNSVNAGIFRYNAVTSHNGEQFVAYYDEFSRVVLAKRQLGSDTWQRQVTQYTGNTTDAHNSISIIVDGDGYLHMSWDHHGHPLRYARSVAPGSLTLGPMLGMAATLENSLTYPEFHRLANGSLVFLYRYGSSGNGNVVMNRYDLASQTWSRVHHNLLSGQGQRNAYWQTCTDSLGNIHLSWTWRENSNANSNHDIGYAVSADGGATWRKTTGQQYSIPITAASSEYATLIPIGSDLMNQTSMSADGQGRPYIVNYWTPAGQSVPQFHVVYHDGVSWHVDQITDRGLDFSVSGFGSLSLPCSRPKIVVDSTGALDRAVMLYRDEERSGVVTAMICDDLSQGVWRPRNLTGFTVDKWEPNFDTEAWKNLGELHLYVQRVGQGPNETLSNTPPQMVSVLEWTPW